MRFYFPIHIDGGNRGCEGIAKGTAKLLGLPKEQLIGLCSNIQLDTRLEVDNYVTLEQRKKLSFCQRVIRKLLSLYSVSLANKYSDSIVYRPFIDKMMEEDIMVSTGGDMMCYNDNEVIYTNNLVHQKGLKSILWGCSVGKNNLTPAKIDTLKKFSLIYARESLTYELIKSLNLGNVILFPDPAFALQPEQCTLPEIFKDGDVVGINLSNYVVGGNNLDTPFGLEVKELIDYIINKTNLNILLIPHVLWNGQDDRLISKEIVNHYNSNRISVLDSDSLNYEQIRYVISKCLMFIGARTHAIISAYATCTPAIALGYSVKARGIAKDLQLNENLVVDSKNFRRNQLLDSFCYALAHVNDIKSHLKNTIPLYMKKLETLRETVCSMLNK
ncbi:MAG: polysaccharide pyruvyl transferase family protein [Bacteroides sp.]|nr:polysaccharide pyruvyl transferase family protein [Bacteroides sp.]